MELWPAVDSSTATPHVSAMSFFSLLSSFVPVRIRVPFSYFLNSVICPNPHNLFSVPDGGSCIAAWSGAAERDVSILPFTSVSRTSFTDVLPFFAVSFKIAIVI
jgi:hypothetical protein